jgi:PQQ-dependent catabolism-associated CXXCW motif protein
MRMSEAIDAMGEPYPGLRSFRRDETHIFFGREGTISEMVDRLAAHRFLAVTGISGSGKSSLVKTGLLDALDRGLLVEAGSDWRVADFRPGGTPLTRLTAALVEALEKTVSDQELGLIEAKLASGPMGLAAWLDEIDFPRDTNILLLVDQFEEIFRYRQGQSGEDIDAFVALLLASAKQRKRRIYVVITMRSDFLGDCARFTDLAETINDGQFLTPRLTREQCREAITGPAAVYRGKVEPALVTRMLNDMGGNPDQLPLMQHVLMLLWERANARGGAEPELTLEDYKSLGGIGTAGVADDPLTTAYGERPGLWRRLFGRVSGRTAAREGEHSINGALSDHADRVLAKLTPEQQRLAAILFRALTQGEGVGGRDVRRPITLAQAAAIAQVPPNELVPIIKAFAATGRNFLVPPDPDPLAADKTMIDITHESLIRQWVRLRRWVREEYVSAENYRHIERSAKQWRLGLGNLLMKLDLAVARRWRKAERPNAAWAERYGDSFDFAMRFLRKSTRHRRWRKGIATVAGLAVAGLVLSTTAVALFLAMVMFLGLSYVNPADEWSDFSVAAQSELKRDIGTNTPLTIPGGKVIGTGELETAINRGALEGVPFLIIDALKRSSAYRVVVPGSKYLSYAGDYGTFDDNVQTRLKEDLAKLTNDNLDMPVVFFCAGAKCWESYNAALRTMRLGYSKVYWYRGGIASWEAAHRPYPIDFDHIPLTWSGMLTTTAHEVMQTLWPDPDFNYKRGLDYKAKGQFDSAVSDFSEAIKRNPNHTDAYFHRALAFASKGDLDEALSDFLKVVELDPGRKEDIDKIIGDKKFAEAYIARGTTYFNEKDYDRAIQEYSHAIRLDPGNATAYAYRGFAYYRKEDYDTAILNLDEAIKLDPRNAAFYNGRGNMHSSKGAPDQSIQDYTTAIKLDPKIANYWVNRGDVYDSKGDYARAIADYGEAIKLEPSATTHNRRGNAYFAQRDYDRAIKDYDDAIRLAPRDHFLYSNRGDAYSHKGDCDRAIRDYDEAIKLDPKFAAAYDNRGTCYLHKRDYDRAIKDFDQAIALEPKRATAYEGRGTALFYKQDYDGAIRDHEKASEFAVDKSTAFEHLGQDYFAKHDFARAIQEYDKAVALRPNSSNVLSARARAEIYAERFEPAIADLAKAATLDAGYAYHAIWLHMARVRAGVVNLEELASNTEKTDRARWPWPLAALFLGAAAPETIHPAARSMGDAGEHADQVCEADFYLGFYRLANGERAAAQRLFEAVVNTCPRHNVEYQLGRIELERLR